MRAYKKLFRGDAAPTLMSLLQEARLQLVEIGGRGSAFSELVSLARVADYFVSEPDRVEAERLAGRLRQDAPWRSVTVMFEAIGARCGTATLHVTHRPGMSSLLEPDPSVASRFCKREHFDVARTVTVPVLTLEEAARRYGFSDAGFLKIDTQGTELDVLTSGASMLLCAG